MLYRDTAEASRSKRPDLGRIPPRKAEFLGETPPVHIDHVFDRLLDKTTLADGLNCCPVLSDAVGVLPI